MSSCCNFFWKWLMSLKNCNNAVWVQCLQRPENLPLALSLSHWEQNFQDRNLWGKQLKHNLITVEIVKKQWISSINRWIFHLVHTAISYATFILKNIIVIKISSLLIIQVCNSLLTVEQTKALSNLYKGNKRREALLKTWEKHGNTGWKHEFPCCVEQVRCWRWHSGGF